jgi:hypothetical protein
MKKVPDKPFDEALAELISSYAKSDERKGGLTLEKMNAYMRMQIQANEESGET